MVLAQIFTVLEWVGRGPLGLLLRFANWFYLTLIPFVLKYIGIPMFALGVLLALSFTGGTILFIIVFAIFMYYFIKGTIFNTQPTSVKNI